MVYAMSVPVARSHHIYPAETSATTEQGRANGGTDQATMMRQRMGAGVGVGVGVGVDEGVSALEALWSTYDAWSAADVLASHHTLHQSFDMFNPQPSTALESQSSSSSSSMMAMGRDNQEGYDEETDDVVVDDAATYELSVAATKEGNWHDNNNSNDNDNSNTHNNEMAMTITITMAWHC